MKMMDWVPSTHIYEYPYVPLKFSRLAGSQVIAHAKALVGTVNTASLNLPAAQGGPITFTYDFQHLTSLEEAPHL